MCHGPTRCDLDVFAQAIDDYGHESKKFRANIPSGAGVGVYAVDSAELRATLLPSPDTVSDALKALLPVLMQRASGSVLDELKRIVPIVHGAPSSVEETVAG